MDPWHGWLPEERRAGRGEHDQAGSAVHDGRSRGRCHWTLGREAYEHRDHRTANHGVPADLSPGECHHATPRCWPDPGRCAPLEGAVLTTRTNDAADPRRVNAPAIAVEPVWHAVRPMCTTAVPIVKVGIAVASLRRLVACGGTASDTFGSRR
jgi:hypothetical protein